MTGNQDSGNGRIVVINPNSSDAVTNAMNIALDPLRLDGGPHIDCVTMSEGPPGIETQEHVDDAVGRICQLVKDEAVVLMPLSLPVLVIRDYGQHANLLTCPYLVLLRVRFQWH